MYDFAWLDSNGSASGDLQGIAILSPGSFKRTQIK